MPDAGLDAEKLRLLDEWAEGLQRDDRPEVAAAGRAILMLVAEIERLHVHLWDSHLNLGGDEPSPAPEPVDAVDAAAVDLHVSLRERLFGRRSDTAVER